MNAGTAADKNEKVGQELRKLVEGGIGCRTVKGGIEIRGTKIQIRDLVNSLEILKEIEDAKIGESGTTAIVYIKEEGQ